MKRSPDDRRTYTYGSLTDIFRQSWFLSQSGDSKCIWTHGKDYVYTQILRDVLYTFLLLWNWIPTKVNASLLTGGFMSIGYKIEFISVMHSQHAYIYCWFPWLGILTDILF